MKILTSLALATVAVFTTVPAAFADEIIGSYVAYIGRDDLYNSKGARLKEPWQILRQDRANYHRFGISQSGDEWDPFFSSKQNRAIMERMIMNGSMSSGARSGLVQGGATVFVRIYGSGSRGKFVKVTVVN